MLVLHVLALSCSAVQIGSSGARRVWVSGFSFTGPRVMSSRRYQGTVGLLFLLCLGSLFVLIAIIAAIASANVMRAVSQTG